MWVVLVFLSIFILLFLLLFLRKTQICDMQSCSEECGCDPGGSCIQGKCCYPNCTGLHCGDDGCGGVCECDSLPNGVCNSESQRCCYSQDCNNVFCGDDGCGGVCGCLDGATCKNGVCVTPGKADWTYQVFDKDSVKRKNTSSSQECASWTPENISPHFLNFQCQEDSDCPKGDSCILNKTGKKFCSKNNVYRYWIYDPSDPSGFNCSKIRQGSAVCGVKKQGAVAFDIVGNQGPDVIDCNSSCVIKTSNDLVTQAQISNGECGMSVTGQDISVNSDTFSSFLPYCSGKNRGDPCVYNDGKTSYKGLCISAGEGNNLYCFPPAMCVAKYTDPNKPGICSSSFTF